MAKDEESRKERKRRLKMEKKRAKEGRKALKRAMKVAKKRGIESPIEEEIEEERADFEFITQPESIEKGGFEFVKPHVERKEWRRRSSASLEVVEKAIDRALKREAEENLRRRYEDRFGEEFKPPEIPLEIFEEAKDVVEEKVEVEAEIPEPAEVKKELPKWHLKRFWLLRKPEGKLKLVIFGVVNLVLYFILLIPRILYFPVAMMKKRKAEKVESKPLPKWHIKMFWMLQKQEGKLKFVAFIINLLLFIILLIPKLIITILFVIKNKVKGRGKGEKRCRIKLKFFKRKAKKVEEIVE